MVVYGWLFECGATATKQISTNWLKKEKKVIVMKKKNNKITPLELKSTNQPITANQNKAHSAKPQ